MNHDPASTPGPATGQRLDRMPRGTVATITAVDGDDALARQLDASGLWVGATVERLQAAPFGDPLLFRVHGFRLALRVAEAARVRVEPRS